jgi:hypothetical protein
MGFLNALVDTTQQVLLRPREFFESMPVTGGVGAPLLYAFILGFFGLVVSTLYNQVFTSVYNQVFTSVLGQGWGGGGRPAELERLLELLQAGGGTTVTLLTGPVVIIIRAFVIAGVLHVLLLMLGGAHRDFEATFRAVCYAHAVNVIELVPFCGGLVALVWALVVITIGLSAAQRTSTGVALTAVLLPALVCCCCVVVAVSLLVFGFASAFGHITR